MKFWRIFHWIGNRSFVNSLIKVDLDVLTNERTYLNLRKTYQAKSGAADLKSAEKLRPSA